MPTYKRADLEDALHTMGASKLSPSVPDEAEWGEYIEHELHGLGLAIMPTGRVFTLRLTPKLIWVIQKRDDDDLYFLPVDMSQPFTGGQALRGAGVVYRDLGEEGLFLENAEVVCMIVNASDVTEDKPDYVQ